MSVRNRGAYIAGRPISEQIGCDTGRTVPSGVQCLINWHDLTFDLLPRPHSHLVGIKGHTASGTCPPIATAQFYVPIQCPSIGW